MLRQSDPSSVSQEESLAQAELTEVMKGAIRLQSEAERARFDPARISQGGTLTEALEIGRQLGIPEANVRESYRRQLAARRIAIQHRASRAASRTATFVLLGVAGLLGVVTRGFGLPVILPLLIAGFFFWRWQFAPAPTTDTGELTPVPGTCRVCGGAAMNERATFCEEHRYQGVGSGVSRESSSERSGGAGDS